MQSLQMRFSPAIVATALFAASGTAMGQPLWNVYADDLSDSVCDVINATNAELVVLGDTGEFAVITGVHPVAVDWLVVQGDFVFFYDDPVGFIEFVEDGDGFRTLWWLTDFGTVVELDDFTLEPFDSGLFPEEFADVPCGACDLWIDPFDCGDFVVTVEFDGDFDGIDDLFDLCLETPLGEFADDFGCACFEIDSDADGVDDCDDLCPDTAFNQFVDFDGCACSEFDSDGDGVDDCDDICPSTPFGEFVDFDGCACYEIDSDGDGIDDCDDLCPTSFPGVLVDVDGCELIHVDPPDTPVVVVCGSFGMLMMMLTLCGLVSLGGRRCG